LLSAKENVFNLAKDLKKNSPSGVFIIEPSSRNDLQKAVSELEAICGLPSENCRKLMIGDWELICTMNKPRITSSSSEQRTNFFSIPEWLKSNSLQDKLKTSFEVTQRIRCIKDENVIDRVDNVIAFTPFSVSDLVDIPSSPFNLNPLEVSQSKVTLAHKSEVLSINPVLRTKLALQSVILTVKGESKYLDPDGADILGLNVPLGEFLNAGTFDTTYVDKEIRISRGSTTGSFFEQTRVFRRKGETEENVAEEESGTEEKDSSSFGENAEETAEAVVDDEKIVDEKNNETLKDDSSSIFKGSTSSVTEKTEETAENVVTKEEIVSKEETETETEKGSSTSSKLKKTKNKSSKKRNKK